MSVLILSEHDVRGLLDMESCVTAMEGILARLARGELTNPLRFLISPPGPTAMGLMPSHAAGDKPVYALKEIVVAPGNSASGLDPHQGAVLLHDGITGQLIAILNASPITEIRTAAVSGSRRGCSRGRARAPSRFSALACRDAPTSMRCRRCSTIRSSASGAGTATTPRRWRSRPTRSSPVRSRRRWTAPTSSAQRPRRASLSSSSSGSRRARTSTPPGRSRTASRGSSAPPPSTASRFFVDRRESTLNEAGDYRVAAAESGFGPEHIIGELGELLNGTVEGRRSADELTVFKSMGIAVEDLAAAQLCVARARERGAGVEVDF